MAYPTPIIDPNDFIQGYADVDTLLLAPISDLHFLGNIYQTLLTDHGLTEAALTQFFYQFARAYMIHHIDVTKYNAPSDTFQDILYSPPGGEILPPGSSPAVQSKYASYLQYPRRYFGNPVALKNQKTKLAGTYHERFYRDLKTATGKYFSLKEILDGTLVPIPGLPDFLFPEETRNTLRRALGGPALKNSEHLELYIKNDTDTVGVTRIDKRILLCLSDKRINSNEFRKKYPAYPAYPTPISYTNMMTILTNNADYRNIESVATRASYGPRLAIPQADKDLAKKISGRIISGMYSVISEPPGELAHLDIMRFFGQQFSFEEERKQKGNPAYLTAISNGNSIYWKNLHLSTKTAAKATFDALEYGAPTTINYLNKKALYGNVYPVHPANHIENKKVYISEIKTVQQTSASAILTEKLAALEPKLQTLAARKNFFVLKTKYFETPLKYVKETEYDGYLRSYVNLYGVLFNEKKDFRKMLEDNQTTLLSNLNILDQKVHGLSLNTPTLPEFQIDDIVFFRNFKHRLEKAVEKHPKVILKNTEIQLTSCKPFRNGINLEKENINRLFDECESSLRKQMIFLLNKTFRSYIQTDLFKILKEKDRMQHYIQNSFTKFNMLTSYSSVQTISQGLFEFLEKDKVREDGPYPLEMYAQLVMEIIRNIDLEYYSIINPGEAYRTEKGLEWVPPKQRRICFLLDFLYLMNMKLSEISDEFNRQKKPLINDTTTIIDDLMVKEFGDKNTANAIKKRYGEYLAILQAQERIEINYKGKSRIEKEAALKIYKAREKEYLNSLVRIKDGIQTKFETQIPILERISNDAIPILDSENLEIASENLAIENRKQKALEYHMRLLKSILGNDKFIFSLIFPINQLKYTTLQLETMRDLLSSFFNKTFKTKDFRGYISGGLINSLKASLNKWFKNHTLATEAELSGKAILEEIMADVNTRLQIAGLKNTGAAYEAPTNTRRKSKFKINVGAPNSINSMFETIREKPPSTSLTNDPSILSSGGDRTRSRRRRRQMKRTRKNR